MARETPTWSMRNRVLGGDPGSSTQSLGRDTTFDRNPFRPLPARQAPRQYRGQTRTVRR